MQQQVIQTERKETTAISESKADLILDRIAKLEKNMNKNRWYGRGKDNKNNQNQNNQTNQTQSQNQNQDQRTVGKL